MTYFLVLIAGLVIGSFLNVCIYRIPRGESIAFPPSHCPGCGTPLRPWELVPVLSFLWLRGRCRTCGEAIGWRYPLTELGTALLFFGSYLVFGVAWQLLPALVLAAVLLVVAQVDLEHYRIPNGVVIFGLAAGVALNLLLGLLPWQAMLLGALAGGLPLLALRLLSRGGMGLGDVKLAAMLGIYLGWPGVWLAIFLAALGAAVLGLVLIIFRCRGRKEPLPFGPFLAAGALVALWWGPAMLAWYRGVFLT